MLSADGLASRYARQCIDLIPSNGIQIELAKQLVCILTLFLSQAASNFCA